MLDLIIRPATEDDLPELARLWHEKTTLQQQFDRRLALAADSRAAWQARMAGWLREGGCGVFVAVNEGGLLGYIIGWEQDTAPGLAPEKLGAVTDIALDAHRYQGGAGRALVAALRAWFAARGVEQMVAYAHHASAVEQAFWRSLGATEWIDTLWLK